MDARSQRWSLVKIAQVSWSQAQNVGNGSDSPAGAIRAVEENASRTSGSFRWMASFCSFPITMANGSPSCLCVKVTAVCSLFTGRQGGDQGPERIELRHRWQGDVVLQLHGFE